MNKVRKSGEVELKEGNEGFTETGTECEGNERHEDEGVLTSEDAEPRRREEREEIEGIDEELSSKAPSCMDGPRKPLVPPLAVTLADRLARVLAQKLSDHGLSDRMDDIGIYSFFTTWLSDGARAPMLEVRGVQENVIVRGCG